MSSLVRIGPSFREKPWGSRNLQPLFANCPAPIGEVWFEPGADLPLLVKFLFTEKPLSVQVHPGDDFARLHEGSCGKTEMWYVLRARPGARIGVGLDHPVTREFLGRAARTGEIEDLLRWLPVAPGDVIYVPAGTVHAIGAGLVLCEIQQFSNITYRLYDYGSTRELHLEKALAVSDCGCHPGKHEPDGDVLVRCRHFVTERFRGPRREPASAGPDRIWICVAGEGRINGEHLRAGEVFRIPQSTPVDLEGPVELLRTGVPVD
jgi:mannose-6-phosphate isomerase